MEKLELLIRMVREAQGISQKEIANTIKISQSAITQYEKLQSRLSAETVFKMAPLLNINPEYIEKGIGNPFKQADEQKIIKMFMPETPIGEIDFSLIELIIRSNDEITFIQLTASHSFEMGHKLWRPGYSYALLIEDRDNNKFLFRRKDRNKLLLGIDDLKITLDKLDKEKKKYYEIKTVTLTKQLFEKIQVWESIDINELNKFLKMQSKREHVDFLLRVIRKILSNKTARKNKEEVEKMREIIVNMRYEELEQLMSRLMPEFEEIVKRYIRH